MARSMMAGNKLLAALPAEDLDLLMPHVQNISLELDTVLVHSGDELDTVYFPHSGAVAFMVDLPDGRTVASTMIGDEGAVGALTVLGPSSSPVSVTVRAPGTASQISSTKFRLACTRSFAIRHVVQVHLRTQLLQLQNVAACNAVHSVERRMARWLLQLHDRAAEDVLPFTQDALAQLLGVRRTTVTLTMNKLRAGGAIKYERRGLLAIDRARLQAKACECYQVMQSRIGRMYHEQLSVPERATVANSLRHGVTGFE
jgi:CRP-like cAMP-binding protein